MKPCFICLVIISFCLSFIFEASFPSIAIVPVRCLDSSLVMFVNDFLYTSSFEFSPTLLKISCAPISAKKKLEKMSSSGYFCQASSNADQYLLPLSYSAIMFLNAFSSSSLAGLYLQGKFGHSLLQALLQTSSCLHSSYVTAARNFFVGSSMLYLPACKAASPKAPIPDFSKSASLDIQYA